MTLNLDHISSTYWLRDVM